LQRYTVSFNWTWLKRIKIIYSDLVLWPVLTIRIQNRLGDHQHFLDQLTYLYLAFVYQRVAGGEAVGNAEVPVSSI